MSRFTRIEKLESRRRGDNEMLMLWRKPGQESEATALMAKAAGFFSPGDLVICAEWFGDSSAPAPRWYRKRLSSELARPEYDYIIQSLNRLVETGPVREPGLAPIPSVPEHCLVDLTDNDLLHMALGVET